MASLASVGELETHLGRNVDDASGQQMLDLASGAVRAYCGWNLSRETTTFQIVPTAGLPIITLPTLHLVQVVALRVGGQTVDLLSATNRPVVYTKGQMYRPWGWDSDVAIDIDVIHGYDTVPDLVKLCVLDLAARQLNNPMGLVSATVSSVTRTWASGSGADPSALSALHERLLDRFRVF